MRYISTRRKSPPATFDQAVLRGQAPDGGLYVPVSVPQHPLPSGKDVENLADLARQVLPMWIGREVNADLARDVFSIEIPVIDLGARASEYDGIHVVELFHGPTGSFKDFAARFLSRWLSTEMPPPEGGRIVLVATSGDTGSAVAEGFSGLPRTSVVVLYPYEGVSAYQRAQLAKSREGVFPYAVRGSFDDCQRAVKEAFRDHALSHAGLTSANSINIGRLLPQMLFYFWSAMQVECPDPIFVVPSGNLGNLCAGLMAGNSSMPDARFIAATNKNRYLLDYLANSDAEARPVKRSLSNAMDVAVPSNLERIVRLFGRTDLKTLVSGVSISDKKTRETIHKVWSETGYVADPHTAVGLKAALTTKSSRRPRLVMATADPAKYNELVREVTGVKEAIAEEPSEAIHEEVIDSGLGVLRHLILDIVDRNKT
ncbi:MAG: threonine synthase [Rhodothermales bacterium]